jgi:hypothetical protein
MSECLTGPVIFNYPLWAQRYPEFSQTVGPDLAQLLFAEAGQYCDNSPCSVICDIPLRTIILNALVAHLAVLNVGANGSPASPLVGRLSDASEGSVSVSTEMGNPGDAGASVNWYMQSKYGASAWQLMSPYRLGGRYTPGAVPYLGVSPFGWGSGGYGGRY